MGSCESPVLSAVFVKKYHAMVDADRKAIHDEVAAEDARISVESMIVLRADAHSERLQEEHEKVSSLVAKAKAEVVQAETEVVQAEAGLA